MPAEYNLEALTPKIITDVVMSLKENCAAVNLVNSSFSGDAANVGKTIDIPIPTIPEVKDVNAGKANLLADDVADSKFGLAKILLDRHKKVHLELTDAQLAEFLQTGRSKLISQAGLALGTFADQDLCKLAGQGFNLLLNNPGAGNNPTIPSDPDLGFDGEEILNDHSIPYAMRSGIIRNKVARNFKVNDKLRQFQQSGRTDVLRDAVLGRFAGFDWYQTNNLYTHTKGTLAATTQATVNGAHLKEASVLKVTDGTGLTGTIKKGDHLSIAGYSSPFVVTADATAAANAIEIPIAPALPAALVGGEAVTLLLFNGTRNLLFQEDAIGMAVRRLSVPFTAGNIVEVFTDPNSGLTVQMEITRMNLATQWIIHILYGFTIIRPFAGAILLDQ